MLNAFISTVDALNHRIGRALAWCLPVMTVVTLVIIISSSLLRMGWVWLGEIVVYLHAALFMLGAANTLLHDEHVRIDLFYSRLSPIGRARVNIAGVFFLLLPACATFLYFSWPYVADSWAVQEHSSERQGLPAVFILKTCLLLFPALMILQGLSLAARSWRLLRGDSDTDATAPLPRVNHDN